MRLLTLVLALGSFQTIGVAQQASPDSNSLNGKITQLIKQLGTDQFRARERAQRALEEMGLLAFDALHEAQAHDDIEIAARAKFLIRSMRVDWTSESDHAETRRILKGYARAGRDDRKNRMERLAKIEGNKGVSALCRIVRYETDGLLSRSAALMIMNSSMPEDWNKPQPELAATIRKRLGHSQRVGSKWLYTYAESLLDIKTTLDKWETLATAEERILAKHRGKTNREIVRDLVRWQAEVFAKIGDEDRAEAAIKRAVRLLDGSQTQLTEMLDWLMGRKAWDIVDDLHKHYANEFSKNSLLLYRLAEAKLKSGDSVKANEFAKMALALDKDDLNSHLNAAYALRDRGQMTWCRDEFQHVIDITKPGTVANLFARILISEIYHDFDQDLQAAEALKGVIDLSGRPEIAQIITDRLRRDLDGLKSRMNYFYALHYGQNDVAKAKLQLKEGIKKDPYDPDILIAMHRFSGDPDWAKKTKRLIEASVKHYMGERKQQKKAMQAANDDITKNTAKSQLAHINNQLAWLISNTFGDREQAIQFSHESLELRPDTSAYLDTLGRCYFSNKDYDNAIKYQKKAVEMEPHSAQMKRQLKLFEEARNANLPAKGKSE